MKIEQLISAVNESVNNEAFADLAKKEKEIAAAATKPAPNLTVVPGGKNTGAATQQGTAPVSFGKGVPMPTNPITVPGAGTSAVPPTATPPTTPVPATGPGKFGQATQAVGSTTTGDPVLDQQPAPKQPGKTIAQRLGSFAKGIGAVAGAPAGIGRAIKKGYEVGANAIGGPGASTAPSSSSVSAPSTQSAAPSADVNDELTQLKSTLQTMDQRLRRAGI